MNVKLASLVVLLFCNFGAFVHRVVNETVLTECKKNKKFSELFNNEFSAAFVKRAAEPDNRRGKDKNERYKHYFHVNAYNTDVFSKYINREEFKKYILKAKESGDYRDISDVDKYMKVHGDLPWTIVEKIELIKSLLSDLYNADGKKDVNGLKKKILTECINLAHYITDFCTPLHLNRDYDGRYSDQEGLHKMWETSIPNLLLRIYRKEVIGKYKSIRINFENKDLYDFIFELMFDVYKKSVDILDLEQEIFDVYKSKYKEIYYKKRFRSHKYIKLSAEYYSDVIIYQINLAISLITYIFNKHIFVD